MNLNRNPMIEELRELIRNCDDSSGHHVLWVKQDGEVELSKIPANQTPNGFEKAPPDLKVRFETFQAGNEYVGPDAAADDEWVSELFESLGKNWQQAKGKSEVVCADSF